MTTQEISNRLTDEVFHLFAPSVIAVYRFAEKLPVQVGSAFAVEYRSRKFVLTAAHVMDLRKGGALALVPLTGGAPILIEGKYFVVNPEGQSREDDPFDFAWHELTEEEAAGLRCIPHTLIEDATSEPTRPSLLSAMGFPASKNKTIRPENLAARRLEPKIAQYMDSPADTDEYFNARGMSSATHVAVQRSNRSIDRSGEEDNTIGHKGLSGGPFIRAESAGAAGAVRFAVCGMILEGGARSGLIAGVRLSEVLRHIDKTLFQESND